PLGAVQGRDLDGRTLDRLGDRDRDGDLEVAVGALHEDRRGRDAGDHVQVPRRAAAGPVLTLAGDADPAAVPHPRRDLDPVPLPLQGEAGAAAGFARVLDDLAASAALWARPADGEEPLALGVHTGPAAAGAGDRGGSRLGAGAVTRAAGRLLR